MDFWKIYKSKTYYFLVKIRSRRIQSNDYGLMAREVQQINYNFTFFRLRFHQIRKKKLQSRLKNSIAVLYGPSSEIW